MTIDLSEKQSLGRGFTVSFQVNQTTKEVRAVVKNMAGEVVIRGPVVKEEEALSSKREAIHQWMEGDKAALGVRDPNSFRGHDRDDEYDDEEEEDEESEEEDEEYI